MTAHLPFFRLYRQAASLVCAAVLSVCAASSADAQQQTQSVFGSAVDWSVLARLTETLEVDSNRRLRQGEEGLEARGIVGLNLTVAGRTKRSRFQVRTGLDAGRSTDNDISNLNRLDPNIAATMVFLGKRFSVNADLTARSQATSVSELEDSGITNLNSTRLDASASVGVTWRATERDSLTLTTSAQFVDFSRTVGTLTPSKTFGVTLGWARQATKTTTYTMSTSFRHFEADGASGRTSRTVNAQAGIQHRRTSRHSLGGSAGLSFVSSDLANGDSSTQIGFVGGGSFDYKLEGFTAGLDVNQSVQPSSDGELNSFTSLSGDVAYRINSLQSLGFRISYTRRSDISGGGDVLQFVSLGPTYNYSLTKDSSLSLGYRFRLRDDVASDLVAGHQVMLTLAHDLTLLQ